MPASEAQKRAVAKYVKKNYERYTITLLKQDDAELIQYVETEKLCGGTPTTAVRKLYAQRKGEK